jgi:hypothetical protein
MRYSNDNVKASVSLQLAEVLRSGGFDVYWRESDVSESHTSSYVAPRGLITISDDVPSDPQYIVRLNSGDSFSSLSSEEVAIPVMTVQTLESPRRTKRYEMGSSAHYRERVFIIDGFAKDAAQQGELYDLLYNWLEMDDRTLWVKDYSDPDSPVELPEMDVTVAVIETPKLLGEKIPKHLMYYIKATVLVTYVD